MWSTNLCTIYILIIFAAILESYNLGSKSNISRIKTALQDKEMIDFDKDKVYLEDPVFKLWFLRFFGYRKT